MVATPFPEIRIRLVLNLGHEQFASDAAIEPLQVALCFLTRGLSRTDSCTALFGAIHLGRLVYPGEGGLEKVDIYCYFKRNSMV